MSIDAPITLARGGLRIGVAGQMFNGDLTTLAPVQEQANTIELPLGTTTVRRHDSWRWLGACNRCGQWHVAAP